MKRFDYFSEYSYFTTDNDVPNNGYRNGTYAGRFGVMLGSGTDLSGTLRHIDGKFGSPNGFALYGIADDSTSDAELLVRQRPARSRSGPTAGRARSASARSGQTTLYVNPTPTGEPFDPFGFGANYLGQTVTLRGANGYDRSPAGRSSTSAAAVSPAVREPHHAPHAVRPDHVPRDRRPAHLGRRAASSGSRATAIPTTIRTPTRNNGGAFVEGRGSIGGRTHISAGVGVEHNAAFETAVTPRAVDGRRICATRARGAVGDTKLVLQRRQGHQGA